MTICALCGSPLVGAHVCWTDGACPVRHGVVFSGPPCNSGFAAEAVCVWTWVDNGSWSSACGLDWSCEDGTPTENGMNFCPFCGAKLKQQEAKETP